MFYLKTVDGVHIVTRERIRFYFECLKDALAFICEQKEVSK